MAEQDCHQGADRHEGAEGDRVLHPLAPDQQGRGAPETPGDEAYSPLALDVLRIVNGAVADIVTFDGAVFGWFGLPATR